MANHATRCDTTRWNRPRLRVARGFVAITTATILVFALGAIIAPSSISHSAIIGMVPFAAVLAIAGLGQMLVVQQGGIDLSVAGGVSLAVVIVTHQPDGDSAKLGAAVAMAIGFAIGAGLINGLLVTRLRLNSIIATLGMNALLYGAVFAVSGGTPRSTTRLLASIAGNTTWGIPNAALFAVAALVIVSVLTGKTVAGRRFEAIGANPAAARAVGLRVRLHRTLAFVWAQLLYCLAGALLAGITHQPTAFQGDSLLLPSVAVVVLAGTSLLGGRGFPVSTVIAAVFLRELQQFVLALGVDTSVQTLVQAIALAVGVALYSVHWSSVRSRLFGPRPSQTGDPRLGLA
ncbi:MAG: ABC transporter permease [Deltaproteobacteria bacterium]|nr:MAG: ABC transporter permease [Deltaproteobacteria bacterium]TMQ11719.1 MAG: ABC transporter permease [Deltaproteobacteria bacterium]